MGYDWNPGPKAKIGFEEEFKNLWMKLHHKSCFFRERKIKRFKEITIEAFETLSVPRVGHDPKANEWVLKQYPNRKDPSISETQWVEQFYGFYVVELVDPCDGLPRYSNGSAGGYVELYSFRGQFLNDCADIIGDELLEAAWNSKLPEETKEYGDHLIQSAMAYAKRENINTSLTANVDDPDSKEFHYDVVIAAGNWCRFWAERGHWLEAYF
jgi:hypothetical protein